MESVQLPKRGTARNLCAVPSEVWHTTTFLEAEYPGRSLWVVHSNIMDLLAREESRFRVETKYGVHRQKGLMCRWSHVGTVILYLSGARLLLHEDAAVEIGSLWWLGRKMSEWIWRIFSGDKSFVAQMIDWSCKNGLMYCMRTLLPSNTVSLVNKGILPVFGWLVCRDLCSAHSVDVSINNMRRVAG